MAAVRYNIPPLFRRANKLVCGPNLASRILSLLLSLSLSLLLARLDADCTPLSLIYVPKPVVSCALPPPPPLRRHESDITRGKVGGSGAWQHRCAASGKKKHFYGATIRSDRSSIIGNCPFVPSASSSTSFFFLSSFLRNVRRLFFE